MYYVCHGFLFHVDRGKGKKHVNFSYQHQPLNEHEIILFVRSGLFRQSEVLVAARWQRIWVRMYLTNVWGKSGGTISTGCPFSIEVGYGSL